MKFNLPIIALASVAITGVAALPVLTEDNAAAIIARAELDQDTASAAALAPGGEEGDYNDNILSYVWPDDLFNGRIRRGRFLDLLRKYIMYLRGDQHTCGLGTQNIGLCGGIGSGNGISAAGDDGHGN